MTAASKRAVILEAAAAIVEASGAAHLTIDAVATAASISKGGVLYHFPSKQALLEGMLERLLDQMARRRDMHRAANELAGHPALLAHILEEHHQRPAERAMSRAILAAAAEDPELLAPARRVVASMFAEVARGSAADDMGWVLLLAVEGLRFLEMVNLLPLSRAERRRIHARLLQLARTHAA